MDDYGMRQECKSNFDRIEERLDNNAQSFREHRDAIHANDIQLTELKTNMNVLVKSIESLTRGIWGMVSSLAIMGLGFIIWFIQTN